MPSPRRGCARPVAAQVLALGLVHVASRSVIYTAVGTGARSELRTRPVVARAVTRVSGAEMIDFGVALLGHRLDSLCHQRPDRGESVTDPIVPNPDFEAVVRGSFAQQGLMSHLGAQLARVEPGHVEIEAPFRDELTQQHGLFHGGVTTAIADSACGYSALTLMPPNCEVLSVEFKINLLAPARGERLVARGRVVKSGRTITVCQGDVYAVARDQETHCATMVATMMRVDHSAR